MTTPPESTVETNMAEPAAVKTQIYPKLNPKVSGLIKWLGLGFVLIVLWLQGFSGYS